MHLFFRQLSKENHSFELRRRIDLQSEINYRSKCAKKLFRHIRRTTSIENQNVYEMTCVQKEGGAIMHYTSVRRSPYQLPTHRRKHLN